MVSLTRAQLRALNKVDRFDGKADGVLHSQGFEKYLRYFPGENASAWETPEQSYLVDKGIKAASKSLGVDLTRLGIKRNDYWGLGLKDTAEKLVNVGYRMNHPPVKKARRNKQAKGTHVARQNASNRPQSLTIAEFKALYTKYSA